MLNAIAMNNVFETASAMLVAIRAGIREVAPGDARPLVILATATGDQVPVTPAVLNSIVGYELTSADYKALVGSEVYYDKSAVKAGELFAWNRNATDQQKAERDLNITNLIAVVTTERADGYLASHCAPVKNDEFDALLAGKPTPTPKGMVELPDDDDDEADEAEVIESAPLTATQPTPATGTRKAGTAKNVAPF